MPMGPSTSPIPMPLAVTMGAPRFSLAAYITRSVIRIMAAGCQTAGVQAIVPFQAPGVPVEIGNFFGHTSNQPGNRQVLSRRQSRKGQQFPGPDGLQQNAVHY